MADGMLKMNPAEAIAKADEMNNTAADIKDLLSIIKRCFDEIDNVETGTYQGSEKAVQLKSELDTFSEMFEPVYEQIVKSSTDIKAIATTMMEE